MNVNDFINIINKESIDYNELLGENISIIYSGDEYFDINFIITVRGRISFSEPMYSSFLEASKNSDLKICYTIVEHSYNPEHSKFCKKNNINYIWIKATEESMFNKCLCYNLGAFFGPKSKYLLFHDIDCLIKKDFFNSLIKNIENKKCRAIQCFQKRRVLYCDEHLTGELISKTINVDELSINHPNISLPFFTGAPGGSIMVESGLFFDVGGYDDEFFMGNSPEDAFFWEKIDCIDKMEISDNPEIEIFHMNHPVTYYDNPFIHDMKKIFDLFKSFDKEDKIKYIKEKSDNISKYGK